MTPTQALVQPTSTSTIPYQDNALNIMVQGIGDAQYLGTVVTLKGINRRWYFTNYQAINPDAPCSFRICLFKVEPNLTLGSVTLSQLFVTSASTFGPVNLPKIRRQGEDNAIIQKVMYDRVFHMPVGAISAQPLHKAVSCHVNLHNMKQRFKADTLVTGTDYDLLWVVLSHNVSNAAAAVNLSVLSQDEVYFKDM